MQIVSNGDLSELSNPVSGRNKNSNINLSSAELAREW